MSVLLQLQNKIKQRSFRFYLIVSFTIHLLAFIAFMLSDSNWFSFNKRKAIQASVRVDMVGLPDIERKKTRAKKPKKKVVSIKSKKKKKKKDTKKKDIKKKKEEEDKEKKKKDNVKKGNKVSEGLNEGSSEAEQMEFVNIYLTRIIGEIKLNWKLPKYLTDQNYYAQLEVHINNSGKVTGKKIVKTSGNEVFDSRVLKAIETSEPFPPPPKEIQKLIAGGIVFGLSSND